MKRFLWLGLVFLSASWLFFIPIFTLPNYNMGLIFLILGILFNTLGFWKYNSQKMDKRYLIVLIPLLISIFVISFPYNLGLIVLTAGIVLYGIKTHLLKKEKANWVFLGISLSGLILTAQTLFLPFYSIFASHNHRVDILSPIVSSFCGLFGLKTSLSNGIVYVQTHQQTYPFITTWENLGFYPWFNILIGAFVLFFFLPRIKKIGKYVLGFLLFSGVYLILRYVLVIFIFTRTQDINVLWNPILLSLSLIPFALLLMRFAPLKDIHLDLDCFKIFKLDKNRALAMVLVFLFVFSLVGAFVFQDPGTKKEGRILIDELHSDWENTAQEMDKEWYGLFSTYNYYSWAEWLGKYYTVGRNMNDTLTSGLLSGYNVLILKCPTNSYSDEEVKAIVDFVDNGGGLYLIGDHTNLFGMNHYLNQVSENFGITFKADATYELETVKFSTYMTSTYKPDPMLSHPVVQNMEQFIFLTSCTLSAPFTSENVIIGNGLISEPGTYSDQNFFRDFNVYYTDVEYGSLLQSAAVKYGNGRVLAFTDSTCFSSFCIFMGGYGAFNLGAIEYLNRTNTYAYLNTIFIGISITALFLVLFLLRKEKRSMIVFLFLLIGLLSFSITAPVFSHINRMNYPLPVASSDYTKVCFEEEYSNAVIIYSPYLRYDSYKFYGTFFVWTQRVGCFPSLEKTLDDAIKEGDIVVIINPVKSFEKREVDAVTEYVRGGGKVLLVDSVLNTDSTANELLQNYGVQLSYELSDYGLYSLNSTMGNSTIGNFSRPYLIIQGGEDVFVTEDNGTSIAVVEIGAGRIVVVVDSYTFSDQVMGTPATIPDDSLRRIYDTEFYIFEELLLKDK